MTKPVCVKCACFYRCKQNSFILIESMPTGIADARENIRGHRRPDAWTPYKLWRADLWECPDCGHEIVVGFARQPWSEHFEPDFKELAVHSQLTVNDC